jgi:hypothetical protein
MWYLAVRIPRDAERVLGTVRRILANWMCDMIHTIADRWRLPVWTMLQTGAELWVGLAPEFHLHYQVMQMAALA